MLLWAKLLYLFFFFFFFTGKNPNFQSSDKMKVSLVVLTLHAAVHICVYMHIWSY